MLHFNMHVRVKCCIFAQCLWLLLLDLYTQLENLREFNEECSQNHIDCLYQYIECTKYIDLETKLLLLFFFFFGFFVCVCVQRLTF